MLLYVVCTAGEFVWNEGGVVPATCYLRLISRCVIFFVTNGNTYKQRFEWIAWKIEWLWQLFSYSWILKWKISAPLLQSKLKHTEASNCDYLHLKTILIVLRTKEIYGNSSMSMSKALFSSSRNSFWSLKLNI